MFRKLRIQKTGPDPNRVFLVLAVCVFLLGMATKAEVEDVKEEIEREAKPIATAIESTAESAGAEVASELQLTTVFEKTFDEEIVDVIFDTATVSLGEAVVVGWKESAFETDEEAKGKAEIVYPKVLFYGSNEWPNKDFEGYINTSRIAFCGESGEVEKELRFVEVASGKEDEYIVSVSPNEKYISVSKFQKMGQGGKITMLFDSEGNELLFFEEGHIVPPVSQMGFIKYMPPGDFGGVIAPICIYDLNKRKVIDYETVGYSEIPNAEVGGEIFVGKGKFLFSWVSGVKKSVGKLIDVQSGQVLWKKEYDFEITGDWKAVAGKEDLGVFCSSKSGVSPIHMDIVALDWSAGEVLWSSKLNAPLARILIDIDNNIYVASAFGYITSFTPEGKMRWYYEELEKPVNVFYPRRSMELIHYTSLEFSGERIVSRGIILDMIKGVGNWKSSEILSLSKKDGRVIEKERFEGRVMMSSKAGNLGIVINNKAIKILK